METFRIDAEGLNRWDAYSEAIDETLSKTNFDHSPWHVVRADDKRRARLAVMQTILSQFDYTGRNDTSIGKIDELICGTVDLWNALTRVSSRQLERGADRSGPCVDP